MKPGLSETYNQLLYETGFIGNPVSKIWGTNFCIKNDDFFIKKNGIFYLILPFSKIHTEIYKYLRPKTWFQRYTF